MTESIKYKEYGILMNRIAGWLRLNKKKFNRRQVYDYFGRVADLGTIEKVALERYNKNEFVDDGLITEYTECAIFDNKNLDFLPNYVTGTDGTKYYKEDYIDMANRVSAWEVLYGKSPVIVYLKNQTPSGGEITKLFKNAFGDFDNTMDGALAKISGKGYLLYFNSRYNTKTTINRIKNRQGVNCTDSTILFYKLLRELGYTVQIIHVYCSKNPSNGHVRLRAKHSKHTGGDWCYRDPASVLKGNGIKSQWCTSNYTLVAYDPKWIFDMM